MPVYNTNLIYLKQCIKSISCQTFKNKIQLVIIDDGSNEIIKEYLDGLKLDDRFTITIHHNEQNLGICKSLNVGLDLCENELIARMDSDDAMMPNRLQVQYDYFKNKPDTDILGSGIKIFNELKMMMHIDETFPLEIDPKWRINKNINYFIPHPTVMFKKSCIKELNGYDELLKGYPEDFDLWIRALIKRKKIRMTNQVLLLYRSHSDQLSRKMSKDSNLKIAHMKLKLKQALGL